MMSTASLTLRAAALAVAVAVAVPTALAAATTRGASTSSGAGPIVRTPAAERATLSVGKPAAVAPTSTTQGFLGLATSFSTIPVLSGPAGDPDRPFINLMTQLSPGAPFQLRLGGVSADDSYWPAPGLATPPYLRKLTPQMARDIRALLTALNGRAILGLNLEEESIPLARAEVTDFKRYIGSRLIDAFEIGNEPEFFPVKVPRGRNRLDFKIAQYGREFTRMASALGPIPIAGPGSVSPYWQVRLGTVLHDLPARLKFATLHAYALKNCSRYAHLVASDFFEEPAIQGLVGRIHDAVREAAAHGKRLRVDEMNGITCGGKAGFSDSFGEALWALNALAAMWRAGVQGVNFQTVDGDLNQVFTARRSAAGWRVLVQPVYYGLLAFADATPAGSRLLQISDPGLAHFYQFAVRAPDGSERVVVTNVATTARTVGVSASGTHGSGSESLLSAPSVDATSGTTLGGRALSARTGRLIGRARATTIVPNGRGVYEVRVPAHAAAIVTLQG